MIIGIGVDLVENQRIKKTLQKFGDDFAKRILSADEFDEYNQLEDKNYSLAKYFSAKEAMAKALGTGLRKKIKMKEIVVSPIKHGQPQIHCHGDTLKLLKEKRVTSIHLSISNEEDYTIAIVVLENEHE